MDDKKQTKKAGQSESSSERAFKDKLQLIQNGDMGMQETFWVYFLAVFVVLSFAGALFGPLGQIISLAAAGWTVFMIKPVFKAADKYSGVKWFGILAKIFVVFTAAVVCMGVLLKILGLFV